MTHQTGFHESAAPQYQLEWCHCQWESLNASLDPIHCFCWEKRSHHVDISFLCCVCREYAASWQFLAMVLLVFSDALTQNRNAVII